MNVLRQLALHSNGFRSLVPLLVCFASSTGSRCGQHHIHHHLLMKALRQCNCWVAPTARMGAKCEIEARCETVQQDDSHIVLHNKGAPGCSKL